MCDTARYFTVTGHHLEGTPINIEPRQGELEDMYAEFFGKTAEEPKQGKGQSTKKNPGYGSKLSDDELIDKIRKSKNGNKFAELMRGDIEYLKHQCGYPSASEADLALVMSLAFWTAKDAEQMDRIFRRSGLMRPKWDEYRGDRTYGEMTIATAIAGIQEVWGGAKKKRSAKQESRTSAPEKTGLPAIQINNRQLRNTTAEAIAALVGANDPPEIFMRLGQLCQIKTDEDGHPSIEFLKETGIKYRLTQAADFIRQDKEVTSVSPPKVLAQNILAAPDLPFPPQRGIVEVPVLRPDGSILADPGYDQATKLYYRPLPGTAPDPIISSSPDQQDAVNSVNLFYTSCCRTSPS